MTLKAARKQTPPPTSARQPFAPAGRVAVPTGQDQADRYRRLAHAIADTSPTPSLSHDECEACLEFYVDDELHGQNVQHLYPALYEHLQTCDQCARSHELLVLTDAPDLVPARTVKIPATRIMPPVDAATTWIGHVRARLDGGPLGFGFTIQAQHVRRVLAFAPGPMVLRSASRPVTRALLLSDTLVVGHRQVMVQAWALPRRPASAQIEIQVSSANPLPEPLRVALKWQGHEITSEVDGGRSVFESIPIADLAGAQDLRIEFETTAVR